MSTDAQDKMPDEIFATARGSGTVSGVWVDIALGDEPRGEHRYIRADRAPTISGEQIEAVRAALRKSTDLLEGYNLNGFHSGVVKRNREALAILQSIPAQSGGGMTIKATQISMGHGLVDVGDIQHEGRKGILFSPRECHIPIGAEGSISGDYWPRTGDVVIWIDNADGAAVIDKHLSPFLSRNVSAPIQPVIPDDWVLVPKECTREMHIAGHDAQWVAEAEHPEHGTVINAVWEAMLSAAPQPAKITDATKVT